MIKFFTNEEDGKKRVYEFRNIGHFIQIIEDFCESEERKIMEWWGKSKEGDMLFCTLGIIVNTRSVSTIVLLDKQRAILRDGHVG
jgi:hypothetical protein